MPENKTQYTWGYEWDASSEGDFSFGLGLDFNLDLALGYRAVFMWMYSEGEDWLVMNPHIFAELASHSYFAVKLGIVEARILLDLNGYRATPVEY